MLRLTTAILRFCRAREGVTAIEYGLIAAVMTAAIGLAFSLLSEPLANLFLALAELLQWPAE